MGNYKKDRKEIALRNTARQSVIKLKNREINEKEMVDNINKYLNYKIEKNSKQSGWQKD